MVSVNSRSFPSDFPSESSETRDEIDVPNVIGNHYNAQIFRGPGGTPVLYNEFKQILLDIRRSHEKAITIVGNVFIVLLLTALFTSILTPKCVIDEDDGEPVPEAVKVYCEPFRPVDRVFLEVASAKPCYSSKSCVELGDTLRKVQGKFRYNFIMGTYGFVYVALGYHCRSQAPQDGLYIFMQMDLIGENGNYMAMYKTRLKIHEIIREGLECGKILQNYTTAATGCQAEDSSEGCKLIKEMMSWTPQMEEEGGARVAFYDDSRAGHFFNPLSLHRVFSFQYKLVVCE